MRGNRISETVSDLKSAKFSELSRANLFTRQAAEAARPISENARSFVGGF
jgi:hypothetical protein